MKVSVAEEMKEALVDMAITEIKEIRNFSPVVGATTGATTVATTVATIETTIETIIGTTTGMTTGTAAENSTRKDSNNNNSKQRNPDGAPPSGFYIPERTLTFS